MTINEALDTIAVLDNYWVSKVLALYDVTGASEDVPESEARKLLCGIASELADCFPRKTSNPRVMELFEFYMPFLRDNIPILRTIFESEGFDLNYELVIANPIAEDYYY